MSKALSSYNESGYKSTKVASSVLFSDLDLRFLKHPVKRDIVPLTDTDAIRNSIKHLVLTGFYERPFRPTLGTEVASLLFENASYFTADRIKTSIRDVITKYEPRVNSLYVEVGDNSDKNRYDVTIIFDIVGKESQYEIQFFLNRLR